MVEKVWSSELTSVGILINFEHTAPTPVNLKFRAEVEIIEVDGRKIIFNVATYDERGEIGHGFHERFIVNRANFQAKANSKFSG